MSDAKRLEFRTTIAAPVERVWDEMLGDESYCEWTAAFHEGSYFEGSWVQGEGIRFLSPSGDGMIAEIAENLRHERISIRHLGYVMNGVEDTESEAVRAWAPAYENYIFRPVAGGTELIIEQDVSGEFEQMMQESWPKALERLKALCEADGPPSLYEWAGGAMAIQAWIEDFYGVVREDPELAPVFEHMDGRHPTFVAQFIAEVLGGPDAYTRERGGHPNMIRAHLERHLTQRQRARWARLLFESADRVGLPDDPEFRSALAAYVEWGSRLAVINSQPGTSVNADGPMPTWGWGEVGGPWIEPD